MKLQHTIILLFLIASSFGFTQTTIEKNEIIDELLIEKRSQNQSLQFKGLYTIQVFSGAYDDALKIKERTIAEFNSLDQTIEFNTPSYKVWVGCFDNRIDAERNLIQLKNTYPNSFVVKLKK